MNPLGHKLCYCEGCQQKRWTDKDGLFVLHNVNHGPLSNINVCPESGKAPSKQEEHKRTKRRIK